jgi:hypothetical protein
MTAVGTEETALDHDPLDLIEADFIALVGVRANSDRV